MYICIELYICIAYQYIYIHLYSIDTQNMYYIYIIIYTMYPGPGMQIKRNERQEKTQTWKSTIEVWKKCLITEPCTNRICSVSKNNESYLYIIQIMICELPSLYMYNPTDDLSILSQKWRELNVQWMLLCYENGLIYGRIIGTIELFDCQIKWCERWF